MSQQTIGLGSVADDGTGDTLRDGGDKINDNFTELYTALTAANEGSDTTCFPLFYTAATGFIGLKTNTALTYNASTGALASTSFVGAFTGNVTGNADTVTWANEASDTTCFIGFSTAASGSLAPKTNTNMTFNASTGVVTFASSVLTTTDINGGTVDGAIVGGSSAAAGTFTTLTANTSILPGTDGAVDLGSTTAAFNNLHLDTGATINVENGNWVFTHSSGIGTVSTGDLRVTTAGTNTASVVTVGGTQTLTAKTLTSPVIGTSPTAAGATWTDLGTVTTADINGGTIDGAVIGGASAAAGTFTTATATQLVVTQGTITDPALNISSTVTWNDGADTFTAWKLNVTNTASDAASLLMDLQVGGTTVANVTVAGVVRSNAGNSYTTAQFGLGNTTNWGLGYHGAETLRGHLVASGATAACFGTAGFSTAGYLAWGGFNPDIFLFRDGASTLAQRDGTTAQVSRLYRTYTDGSNYERLALQSGAGYFEIATETAGTGTDDISVRLQAAGTGTYQLRGTASQAAELRLYEDTDAGTNYSAFKVGTQAGDLTYTLPTALGAAGSALTDAGGNGTLSWAVPAGGSFDSGKTVAVATMQPMAFQ
jgi:hypothetical protein